MSTRTGSFTIPFTYDPEQTSLDAIERALSTLLANAGSTPGVLDEIPSCTLSDAYTLPAPSHWIVYYPETDCVHSEVFTDYNDAAAFAEYDTVIIAIRYGDIDAPAPEEPAE